MPSLIKVSAPAKTSSTTRTVRSAAAVHDISSSSEEEAEEESSWKPSDTEDQDSDWEPQPSTSRVLVPSPATKMKKANDKITDPEKLCKEIIDVMGPLRQEVDDEVTNNFIHHISNLNSSSVTAQDLDEAKNRIKYVVRKEIGLPTTTIRCQMAVGKSLHLLFAKEKEKNPKVTLDNFANNLCDSKIFPYHVRTLYEYYYFFETMDSTLPELQNYNINMDFVKKNRKVIKLLAFNVTLRNRLQK